MVARVGDMAGAEAEAEAAKLELIVGAKATLGVLETGELDLA